MTAEEYLLSIVSRVDDFAIENLPDIANQIILFAIFDYGAWFIFNGVILFFCSNYLAKLVKTSIQETPEKIALAAISGVLVALFLSTTISYLLDIIKIFVAPKLFILEQALRMVS